MMFPDTVRCGMRSGAGCRGAQGRTCKLLKQAKPERAAWQTCAPALSTAYFGEMHVGITPLGSRHYFKSLQTLQVSGVEDHVIAGIV